MVDKNELNKSLQRISYEILDEIISPVCKIRSGSVVANPFVADIDCYTGGYKDLENEVIKRIHDKYNVDWMDDEKQASPIEIYQPLITVALYILLYGDYKGEE
jgi:hypothetical protein